MKPDKLIPFLILLVVNFLIVLLINYAFLKWIAHKPETTFTAVTAKSAILAFILTILFLVFNKKKDGE